MNIAEFDLAQLVRKAARRDHLPSNGRTARNLVNDGSVDQTDELNAWFDDLVTAGDPGYLPAGHYRAQVDQLIVPAGLALSGENYRSVIDASSATTAGSILQVNGSADTAAALYSDATENSKTVVVTTPATPFAAGDIVFISSLLNFGSTSQPQGEHVRVFSVQNNVAAPGTQTLTLYDPLCDTYLVSDTSTAARVEPAEDVFISKIGLLGPADNTLSVRGIRADRIRHFDIDVYCQRTHHVGVLLADALHGRVRPRGKDIEKSGTGYNVAVCWGSQDVTIDDPIAERSRHNVTHGGGESRAGVPRRITTLGGTSTQCIDAGWDAHPAGEAINCIGHQVIGSLTDGFVTQAASSMLVACSARGVGRHGLLCQPSTTKPFALQVFGFRALRCGGRGVILSTVAGFGSVRTARFHGVEIDTTAATGFEINDTGAVDIEGVDVDGLTVRNAGNFGARFRRITGGAGVRGLDIDAGTTRGVDILDVSNFPIGPGRIYSSTSTGNYGLRVTNGDHIPVNGLIVKGPEFGVHIDATSTYVQVDAASDLSQTTTPFTNLGGATNARGVRDNDGRLTAVSANWADLGEPGIVTPQFSLGVVSNLVLLANRLHLMRFVPSRDMTITKAAFVVTVAASANDPVDVGVLSGDLSTLLASTGATLGLLNSTGVKTPSLSLSLTQGTTYYAALSCGTIGGTAATIQARGINATNVSAIFGSTAPNAIQMFKDSAHPIAAAPASPGQSSSAPLLALRES